MKERTLHREQKSNEDMGREHNRNVLPIQRLKLNRREQSTREVKRMDDHRSTAVTWHKEPPLQ